MAAGRYADDCERASGRYRQRAVGRYTAGSATTRGGGPVAGRWPITVGEYGKELFVPSTDGQIIPQHDLRRGVGGGGTVVVNVTTSDPDRMAAHTVRALRRARFRQGA